MKALCYCVVRIRVGVKDIVGIWVKTRVKVEVRIHLHSFRVEVKELRDQKHSFSPC